MEIHGQLECGNVHDITTSGNGELDFGKFYGYFSSYLYFNSLQIYAVSDVITEHALVYLHVYAMTQSGEALIAL